MRFLVIFMIFALTSMAAAEPVRQISVTGMGRVELPPDMATITLVVTEEADDAAAAISAMSDKIAAVLTRLKSAGLPEEDVQTQALQLTPIWSKRSSVSKARPTIEGFSASSQISIRVKDLSALGSLLNDVVALGANGFQGLQFGLQNPRPQKDEARRQAVLDARIKAELYAKAAGISLGPVVSLSEQNTNAPVANRLMSESMSGEVPVAAGAIAVSAQVSIIFAIAE